MKSKFSKGQSTYKCTECGKVTRDTGIGEGDLEMCASCYTAAEYENAHNDGDHDGQPDPNCPICKPISQSRRCYFIQETVKDEHGNFIPCIAVDGEKGFYKTDWQWGTDKAIAEECADDMNERMGISKKDALLIVISTMDFSGRK